MGMSYGQFWDDDPALATAYRKADNIRQRRMNEELWLAGTYMADALSATVGNMFSKSKNKYKYPSEPKPITLDEIEERKERERKTKMEQLKAKMMSRALSINANMGGKHG